MENADQKKTNNYLSDAPLQDIDDDLLGWQRLRDGIVQAIRANADESGFAVGIKGKWGFGKSTVLNFVEKEITTDFIVFRYNPWLYPKENHIDNFFRELAKVARNKAAETNKKLNEWASKLEEYASYSSVAEVSIKFLVYILWGIVFLCALGGLLGPKEYVSRNITLICLFVIFLCSILANANDLLRGIANLLRKRRLVSQYPYYELKNMIGSDLRKMKQHVVVIIDDLDRLPPEQICDIFQIVKNNGDIQNVTYLLAFDDEIVQEVLAKNYIEQYRSFTDKVIQIAFSLPPPDSVILGNYFKAELQKVLDTCPQDSLNEYWRDDEWARYYLTFVQNTFANFRDVKRVVNAVRMNMPLVFNQEIIEVNPIDFIVIEIIRLKFPQMYDFIKNNKEVFVAITEPTKILGATVEDKRMHKESFDQALKGIEDQKDRIILYEVLKELFPHLHELDDDGSRGLPENPNWDRSLRICAEAIFERYFLYGNYEGDVPNFKITEILNNITQSEYIDDFIAEYRYRYEVIDIISRIKVEAARVLGTKATERNFIDFIFKVSDYLPADDYKLSEIPARFVVTNYVESILKDLSSDVRGNVLSGVVLTSLGIYGSVSIYGPVICAAIFEAEADKHDRKRAFITKQSIEDMKAALKKKIVQWLKSDQWYQHHHFVRVLDVFKQWVAQDKFSANINMLIGNVDSFKVFMTKFVVREETVKEGEPAGKVKYKFDFKTLDSFIDIEQIKDRVHEVPINKEADSEAVQRAYELFQQGINDYRDQRHQSSE